MATIYRSISYQNSGKILIQAFIALFHKNRFPDGQIRRNIRNAHFFILLVKRFIRTFIPVGKAEDHTRNPCLIFRVVAPFERCVSKTNFHTQSQDGLP